MQERSFKGKYFRPKPEIFSEESTEMDLILTPWGNKSHITQVVDQIKNYISSSQNDSEATSPFERLSHLTPIENNLRTAILLSNDFLYREINKEEYLTGCELFAGVLRNNVYSWIQIGQPSIYVYRDQQLTPLSFHQDLSFDFSSLNLSLPSLPKKVIGLNPKIDFEVNSFKTKPGDKIVCISHSHNPSVNLPNSSDHLLENIIKDIISKKPEHSFWVGAIEIN